MAPLRVVIRTDASSAIGLGHAMRCLSIAEALRGANHTVILASASLPASVQRRYELLGVTTALLSVDVGTVADSEATAQVARESQADWLVADGYHFGLAWQRVVRGGVPCLLMLDDEATRPAWDVDVLVNPNLGTSADAYATTAPSAVVLAGAPYALIRSEFAAWRSWSRPIPLLARNVLVTLGGADPHNLTALLLTALQRTTDLSARVIVGATNPHRESLRALIALHGGSTDRFSLLEHVDDMPSQMAWADVAITAGGTTLWELATMRLPALLVQLADNQRRGLQAYVAAGAARALGLASDVQVAQVHHMLMALCTDDATRGRMSRAAAKIVDGGGAARVRGLMESWR